MKLLVVSFWCPAPPDNGSRLRAYNLIRHLAELGHEIELLALAQEELDIAAASEHMKTLCTRGVTLFPSRFFQPTTAKALLGYLSAKPRHLLDTHQPAFAAAVMRACRSGGHDLVLALQLGAAHYVPHDAPVPCVLDEVEISPFVKAVREAGTARERVRRSLTLTKQKAHLRSLARRYRLWLTVSEAEAACVRDLVRGTAPPMDVLPNGVDLRANAYEPDAPYDAAALIYNGALSFSANADAVRWFTQDILPIIQKDWPNACLRVTGRNEAIRADDPLRTMRGVVLTGFLDDLRPVMRESAVCVVPLRHGGGTRLKILEAFALGIPVVSTSRGAEGLDVTDGTDILLADTPQEFAEATLRVMRDPALRAALGRAGRALAELRYGWQAIAARLHETLEQLVLAKRSAES